MTTAPTLSLDISMLYLVAALMAAMLGGLLIYFQRREQVAALAWWGAAYILGGCVIAVWSLMGSALSHDFLLMLTGAGFLACGMVWMAARSFHGQRISWPLMLAGAILWVAADLTPHFKELRLQMLLGAAIIAAYASLTAGELWRERRKSLRARWPAIAIPMLHGFVLMLPLIIGRLLAAPGTDFDAHNVWAAIFAVELVLYAVGTVFVIFVLVSERAVRAQRDAASIDPLTGLLNRRGFAEASVRMVEREAAVGRSVSVLMFDLDHFKSINDRFGHMAGDEVLRLFAGTVATNLRITDLVGRVGGEEFSAVLPCPVDDAALAAERVREAFSTLGVEVDGQSLATTVSIGIAAGEPGTPIDVLIASADTALYRAKRGGRNRVEVSREEPSLSLERTRRMAAAAATEPRKPVVTVARDMTEIRA